MEEQSREETRLSRRARPGEGEGHPQPPAAPVQWTVHWPWERPGVGSPSTGRKQEKETGWNHEEEPAKESDDA